MFRHVAWFVVGDNSRGQFSRWFSVSGGRHHGSESRYVRVCGESMVAVDGVMRRAPLLERHGRSGGDDIGVSSSACFSCAARG